MTSNIDSLIKTFFCSLLTTSDITPDISEYTILVSQLGLRAGGLGILCPHTQAAPDVVITMAFARRNALQGFCIHEDHPNFPIHPTIGALFDISTNTTSKILQLFHCLLPHIAEVTCAPSIPPSDCINQLLTSVSPKSAQSKIKLHLNKHLSHSLHNKVFSNAPNHFHLLPSLLSSQTSYPFIELCCSNPHNRLLNWQFNTGIKHKLCVPLYPTTNQPIWTCGTVVNIFGDHIFKCRRICKIGVHNAIHDGFAHALAPVLSTARCVPPNSTVDRNPSFTSHLTLTLFRSISPLTHIQPHHL